LQQCSSSCGDGGDRSGLQELLLREWLRSSDRDGKSIPEGNYCVDEEDARFEEQDQDQEDEQRRGNVDAASALWVAGEDLRGCGWWRWWRGLRLKVWRWKLWWVEGRVAVGLEILVEVFFESLFERHV
jgi:hypothetical protein